MPNPIKALSVALKIEGATTRTRTFSVPLPLRDTPEQSWQAIEDGLISTLHLELVSALKERSGEKWSLLKVSAELEAKPAEEETTIRR